MAQSRPAAFCAVTLLALLLAPSPAAAQESTFVEEIEVRRVLVDVRVLDRAGRPIEGLGPEDFQVRVGGRTAAVESIEELGPRGRRDDTRAAAARDVPPHEAHDGRLMVLFFQRDPNPVRTHGILRMLMEARRFVDELAPGDRVAVLSYWPRFYLHTDFTSDRDELLAALDSILPFREPEPAEVGGAGPSLLRHLDLSEARNAPSVDAALAATAGALERLPGPKSLLFFGWGLGELHSGIVRPKPGFVEARRSMRQGRIAFFTLDVTQADFHDLEALLRVLSRQTGGLYRSGFHLPQGAMSQVAAALASHYELTVVATGLEPGRHRLAVRLVTGRGTVLHKDAVQLNGDTLAFSDDMW